MKKNILTILLVFAFGLQSCDKFLGIEPKGYNIPKTYEDFDKIMGYVQLCKAGYHTICSFSDDAKFGDGNSFVNYTTQVNAVKNMYSFKHGDIYGENETDSYYNNVYYRIFTFNAIANNALNAKGGTLEKRKLLRAQALVARAYDYLSLILLYAPAYNPATASTDYGVPLVLTEEISEFNYVRNTVAEVYKQIDADLDEAYQNLDEESHTTFRACKAAAHGVRSKMYFYMANYEKALDEAKIALAFKKELVDMKLYVSISPPPGIGHIRLDSDRSKTYPEGDESVESIFCRYPPQTYGFHRGVFASDDLLEVFKRDLPDGAEDMRRTLHYFNDKFGSSSFPGSVLWGPGYYINIGVSVPDLILVAAECYARKGDAASLNEAAILYNKLRDNRIKGNQHVTFTESESAIRKILDERRKEYALISHFRLADLKRLNREPRFAKTITHSADGQTWTLPPNDNRYIFPIPPQVKGFRPDLPDYER